MGLIQVLLPKLLSFFIAISFLNLLKSQNFLIFNTHVELYDVTRDGQRFIMMVPVESLTSQLNVVVNWTSMLEE